MDPAREICGSRNWGAGFSLFGPHRDDILVELEGYDARKFSLRGEKRLLALSLSAAFHKYGDVCEVDGPHAGGVDGGRRRPPAGFSGIKRRAGAWWSAIGA